MVINPMVGKSNSLFSPVDNGSVLTVATSFLSLKGKSILFKYPAQLLYSSQDKLVKEKSS